MNIRLIAAAALASCVAGAAHAECKYPMFDFFPEKNGGVVVDSTITAGSPCTHNFAEGPGYRFDKVTIDRMPEHGALKKTSGTRFVYKPSPGYQGKDFYLFKICATKNGAHGCSTIAFVATIGP